MSNTAGIIIACWETLTRDHRQFENFIAGIRAFESVIIFSQKRTAASTVILRDRHPKSFLADRRIMSTLRLARLCDYIYVFDGQGMAPQNLPPLQTPINARIGFIISNGNGLGHVTRTRAIAKGLEPYAPQAFFSFSAALTKNAFYVPSQQYLELQADEGFSYTREALTRFCDATDPTHLVYDGNVLPDGLLSILAAKPTLHLTWVRRGMWAASTDQRYVAQQALVDLLIEPGDVADAYDQGPAFNKYVPSRNYLKTLTIKPLDDTSAPLNVEPGSVLIMSGANNNDHLPHIVEQVQSAGYKPVIAHWPMNNAHPPVISGAHTIEHMPIAAHYGAFDAIISAAGYNCRYCRHRLHRP